LLRFLRYKKGHKISRKTRKKGCLFSKTIKTWKQADEMKKMRGLFVFFCGGWIQALQHF